jgi:3-dehydroquinate synthase
MVSKKRIPQQRVRVSLGERSYNIIIGAGLLSGAGEHVAALGLGRNGVIISDSNVAPLYGATLKKSLEKAGFQISLIVVPAGEGAKSLRQASRVLEMLPAMGLDRRGFVVALGGGVVGDLVGFIAATYLRGVAFVQVPTTLLAMVDSSVGGKTGVNLPQGKNLVGAFYQPRLVLVDTALLESLPEREMRAGFAEVIKYGAICDAKFFAWLEKNYPSVLKREPPAVAHVVRRCCELKAMVVGKDERESGLRAILNFGHTVGHAMEALVDYEGILHGEAVAMGMCCAGQLSVTRAGLSCEDAKRICALIGASGLPRMPKEKFSMTRLFEAMRLDKKASGGKVRFVLLPKLGKAVLSEKVTDKDVAEVLEGMHVCR